MYSNTCLSPEVILIQELEHAHNFQSVGSLKSITTESLRLCTTQLRISTYIQDQGKRDDNEIKACTHIRIDSAFMCICFMYIYILFPSNIYISYIIHNISVPHLSFIIDHSS